MLALPIIISQLAQMGMTFTDTVMAGRHAQTSLAGVAIGSSLWVPCFLFLTGILMAITPMIAQAWGADNTADIKRSVQQGFWLALITGFGMSAVLLSLAGIFSLMEMESTTRAQATGYVQAVSFGLPAMAMFLVLRGLNEGVHITRPYMYVSLAGMLVNIPLNYAFIYGTGPIPEMGGIGCGWATAIVLYIELLVMIVVTLKQRQLKDIGWTQNWRAPERERIGELLKLGIPIGIALLIESSMFALIALFLAELGSATVAGHQVAMSFISVLFMVPLSLSMALTIRCGYYIGRNEPEAARFVALLGIGFTLISATLFSLIILTSSTQIAALYTTDNAVQTLAIKLLLLAAIFQFSDAVQVSAAGVLRGYKDTRFAFVVVLLAYWGVGLPVGYILGLTDWWGEPRGAEGFWIGLIAGLGLASILLAARVLSVSRHHIAAVSPLPVSGEG